MSPSIYVTNNSSQGGQFSDAEEEGCIQISHLLKNTLASTTTTTQEIMEDEDLEFYNEEDEDLYDDDSDYDDLDYDDSWAEASGGRRHILISALFFSSLFQTNEFHLILSRFYKSIQSC